MKLKDKIVFILALIPFVYWVYTYINADLWYDEVYSLREFILVDLKKTFLDYHAPNNHIFFSFVNQIITRITNCREFFKIIEHVYLLRLFQGLIALFTAYYTVIIIQRFFKLKNGLILLIILFTTIPFLNFSLQLRGYNMSTLFITIIVYHIFAFIENEQASDGNLVIIFCVLLIYTIPSNIYILGAILIPLFVSWLYRIYLTKEKINIYLKIILQICFGVAIATVLYLPVINTLLTEHHITRKFKDIYYSLKLIPILLTSFLSHRYLLLALFPFGIWIFLNNSTKKEKLYYIILFCGLLFPFVLSFIHHKFPFQRTFVPLSPIFCIFISVPIIKLINKIPIPKYVFIAVMCLSLYCTINFYNEIKKANIEVKNKQIFKNIRVQNIYQNYYLGDFFNQKNVVEEFKSYLVNKSVFMYNQVDYLSTDLYLRSNNVNYTLINSIKEIEPIIFNEKEAIIITTRKHITLDSLGKLEFADATVLTTKDALTNIISVKRK